jgi:hypothetical protein
VEWGEENHAENLACLPCKEWRCFLNAYVRHMGWNYFVSMFCSFPKWVPAKIVFPGWSWDVLDTVLKIPDLENSLLKK